MAEWQDWSTVVLKKNRPRKQSEQVAAAKRSGAAVETVHRYGGGQNKTHQAVMNTKKLDDETENFAHSKVDFELKIALQQARLSKKMSQADLAKAINEKQTLINDYEAGRAIPNNAIIAKMERALGARLPRPKKKKPAREGPEEL